MWTDENRRRYSRDGLRDPNDLTDAEWALIEPQIPPARPGSNKRTVAIREVVNGVMYSLSTGCQWRAIPKDLPPRSTIYDDLDRWSHDDTLERIPHALYVKCREQGGREASPTAAVIDSQSVKSAENGGRGSIRLGLTPARRSRASSGTCLSTWTGWCCLASFTLPISRIATAACCSWPRCSWLFPFLLKLYADGGHQGAEFQRALNAVIRHVDVEIVKRTDKAPGFVVLPKRWVVERALAWLGRCRRLAKDWECLNRRARAFLLLASIRLMVRSLCRSTP